jgi:hypothetical protein
MRLAFRRSPAAAALEPALGSLLPIATRPLTLGVAAFAAAGGGRALLSLTVDVAAFGSADGQVPLEIAATAVDRRGRPVASARQTTAIELPRDARAGSREANVSIPLEVPPGDYEVRVAVSDSAGVAASVFSAVAVPAFASVPLSLSDVSVEMGRASARTPAGGPVQRPTTRRAFGPGETVRATVEIYQGVTRTEAIVPVRLRARLVERSGGAAVRDEQGTLGEAAFTDRRAAVSLDIERLPPGEYVLTLEAVAGQQQAVRTLGFEVR